MERESQNYVFSLMQHHSFLIKNILFEPGVPPPIFRCFYRYTTRFVSSFKMLNDWKLQVGRNLFPMRPK